MQWLRRSAVYSIYQITGLTTLGFEARLLIVSETVIPTPLPPGRNVSLLSQSVLYAAQAALFFFLLLRTEGSPVRAAASRIPSHVSAVCAQPGAHAHIASLCSESSPSVCPNKPEQTGRRQRGDVTHSSEPWRLSAWRRSGGLHGDVKQERSHSALRLHSPARRADPREQTGPGALSSIYQLSSSGMRWPPSAPAERPLSAGSERRHRGGGRLGIMLFPHFNTQ